MNKTHAATISAARDAGHKSTNATAATLAAPGHTPGPWIATRRSFNYGCYGHEITAPAHVGNLSTVQKVGPLAIIQTDDDQDRANARLIAAAPELLEIVKTFVSALGRHDTITHKLATMDSPAFAYTMREARAAIAKATGGAL